MPDEKMIAHQLLQIQAVGFKPSAPLTFKSGLLSPVYVDNRRLPFHPVAWKKILMAFAHCIEEQHLDFEVIAGIETAGIPHSAALGLLLKKPSVFVRKKIKDHGTKSRIEGGDVRGKKVLLVEDHVTTGGSSLAGVDALRADGARVSNCLSITSYEFPVATLAFETAGVHLHTMTTFDTILAVALKEKIFTVDQQLVVADWLRDPAGWGERHGFSQTNV